MKHKNMLKTLFLLLAIFTYGLSAKAQCTTPDIGSVYENGNGYVSFTVKNQNNMDLRYYITKGNENAPSTYNNWSNYQSLYSTSDSTEFITNYTYFTPGNYKITIVNTNCANPIVKTKKFTVGCSYRNINTSNLMSINNVSQSIQGDRIDVEAELYYFSHIKATDFEYCLAAYGDNYDNYTPITGGSLNLSLNKDQYNNPISSDNYYYISYRLRNCNGNPNIVTYGEIDGFDLCSNFIENVDINLASDGFKFDITLSNANQYPADGFAYAVYKSGTSPVYPADYNFIGNTLSVNAIDTTFEGSNLDNGENYYIRILSVCDTANIYTEIYKEYHLYNSCLSPQNLTITNNFDSTATITWSKNDLQSGNVSYKYYFGDGSDYTRPSIAINDTTALVDVTESGRNYLIVQTMCSTTDSSSTNVTYYEFTNFCGDTLSNVQAIQQDSTIRVSWDLSANTDVTHYRINIENQYYSNQSRTIYVSNTTSSVTIDTLNGGLFLNNNENYIIQVMSVCDSTNGLYSESVNRVVSIEYVCNATVNNLTLVDNGGRTITATWDAAQNISHYLVELYSNYYFFDTTVTTNSITIPALENGDHYVYVTASCDANGLILSPYVEAEIDMEFCKPSTTVTQIDNLDGTVTLAFNNPNTANDTIIYLYGYDYDSYHMFSSYYNSIDTFDTYGNDLYYIESANMCLNRYNNRVWSNYFDTTINYNTFCSSMYIYDLELTNSNNSIVASFTPGNGNRPNQGYAYKIYDDYGNRSPLIYFNDTIVSISVGPLGNPLEVGEEYEIEIYSVCDSLNNVYESLDYTDIYYQPCYVYTYINMTQNQTTGNISFRVLDYNTYNDITTGFYYAVTDGSDYPQYYSQLTYSNTAQINNINSFWNGTTFVQANEDRIYVTIFPICNAADTTLSLWNRWYNEDYIDNNITYCSNNNVSGSEYVASTNSVKITINATNNRAAAYRYYVLPRNTLMTNTERENAYREVLTSSLTAVNGKWILNLNTNTFDNTAFVNGQTYDYKIVALCDTGLNAVTSYVYGLYSFTVDSTQYNCNSYISGSVTATQNHNAINLEWTTGITDNGFGYAIVPVGTTPINSHFVHTFAQHASVNATTNNNQSFVDGQLYKVYVNYACNSDYNSFSSSTISTNIVYEVDGSNVTTCAPVDSLKVIDQNNGKLTISWDYASTLADGFSYAILPGGVTPTASHFKVAYASPLYNVATTTVSPTDTLVSGNSYVVYVRANCDVTNNLVSDVKSKAIAIYNTLAVDNSTLENMKVYPNPTTGTVTIELAQVDATSMTIVDLTGKVVFESEITSTTTSVDLSNFTNGVYMINVKTLNDVKTTRIVKK